MNADYGDPTAAITWRYAEHRQPEDGDIADCAECEARILFVDNEWKHDAEPEAFLDDDHDPKPGADYHRVYAEGPMMNYFYPCNFDGDLDDAAEKLIHLPVCPVEVSDEKGLALTGGGMDLSWEICEAYIVLGHYPPAHFAANLPKMADTWTDSHEIVYAAGRRSLEIMRDWMTAAIDRLEDTVDWMKEDPE